MKRLAATIGVALLLTTALALPAAAARTTQFAVLEACYNIEEGGNYHWSGSFQIDKGPLPDYVEMSVNGFPVIADSPFLDKAERKTLYAGEIENFPGSTTVRVQSHWGNDPTAPSYALDVQTFDADPCEEA